MITIPFLTKTNKLQEEIDRLLAHMETLSPTDPDYSPTTEQLVKLYKLKEVDNNSKSRVSTDALISACASIFGVLAVIHVEQVQAITTKAVGWVIKPR